MTTSGSQKTLDRKEIILYIKTSKYKPHFSGVYSKIIVGSSLQASPNDPHFQAGRDLGHIQTPDAWPRVGGHPPTIEIRAPGMSVLRGASECQSSSCTPG